MFQRHRTAMLTVSNLACVLTAGMIVCTELYRQEWQQLMTRPQQVLLQRPGMLLLWSHAVVPQLQRLGTAEASASVGMRLAQSLLVYHFIMHGQHPLLSLLPVLAGCEAVGAGLALREEARMRQSFAEALRRTAAEGARVGQQERG